MYDISLPSALVGEIWKSQRPRRRRQCRVEWLGRLTAEWGKGRRRRTSRARGVYGLLVGPSIHPHGLLYTVAVGSYSS